MVASGAQRWEAGRQRHRRGTQKALGDASFRKRPGPDVAWDLLAKGQGPGLCVYEPTAPFWE